MELFDNKTPRVESDNTHEFIHAGMWNNKEKLVKVNGYGAISVNDDAANNIYIVCVKSVPY